MSVKNPLTRRDFFRGTLGTALGATVFKGNFLQGGQNTKPDPSQVLVVRDQKAMDNQQNINLSILEKMLENTLTHLTGKKNIKEAWLSLVSAEDVIGLVPTPHLNPTHNELIDAVENSLQSAGIPKENIKNAQGGPDKPKSCTALIAMPGLKAHWLTGIGTVLKNYIMYSGNPRNYHHQNNSKLGEIWNLPFVKGKTKLVLVDALYPLCDKGPQPDPRYKWNYNGLIAGTDPVAVETICLKIISEKRKEIKGEPWPISPPPLCLEAADKTYHLGTSNMQRISLKTYGWKENLLI